MKLEIGDKIVPNENFDRSKADGYTVELLDKYNGVLTVQSIERSAHHTYYIMTPNGDYTDSVMCDELQCFKLLTVPSSFEHMVRALKKSPEQLVEEYTPLKADLDHMIIGIEGEVGELFDCVKRHTKYNRELDITNAIEEIGDVMFYLEGLCQALNVTIEQCKAANIDKLSVRYSSGSYSNAQAAERADKS